MSEPTTLYDRQREFPMSKREVAKASRVAETLKGRRIERVELDVFDPDPTTPAHMKRPPSTSPTIWFDDGSFLRICVDETEVGEYGVTLCHSKNGRPVRRRSK
jgi:hypothetical protein